MLSRQHRLRDRKAVAAVYRKGQTTRLEQLNIKVLNAPGDTRQALVVVSKKVAKSAPLRNRIRRRIFAHIGKRIADSRPGWLAVISVFDSRLAKLPAPELAELIDELLQKAGLIKAEQS